MSSVKTQVDDKDTVQHPLINEQHHFENPIEIPSMNKNSVQLNQKPFSDKSSIIKKYLFLCILLLLSIIGLGLLIGIIVTRIDQLTHEIKMNDNTMTDEQTKINQIIQQLQRSIDKHTEQLNQTQSSNLETIYQLIKELHSKDKNILEKQTINNRIIEQLNDLRLIHNQTIQELTNELQHIFRKHRQQKKIIQQLLDKQTEQNLTIDQLNVFRFLGNQTIDELNRRVDQLYEQQIEYNQTIENLLEQLEQSFDRQVKQNETIQYLNDQLEQAFTKSNITTISNQVVNTQSIQKLALTHHPHIDPDTKWQRKGVTVAGSNEENNSDLPSPFGFRISDDRSLIIADYSQHRILEWKLGASNGQVIAGGHGKGNRYDQLNYPTDVIIDPQTNRLIICDRENTRVVTWPRRNGNSGQVLLPNIRCFGLTMDIDRYLYVSDLDKHEVKRWNVEENEGIVVAGGHGRGDRLDQLNSPHYLFIDDQYTLYVSDTSNHRIMKWLKDTKEGMIVGGGHGPGSSLRQLASPEGIYVDDIGSMYVADCSNHRIIRWLKDSIHGDVIVGGKDYGSGLNELSCPMYLSFDIDGHMYVADYYNKRIQKFNILQN